MVERKYEKEVRLRLSKPMHCVMVECLNHSGFSNISEFVRVAIIEKIRKDCQNISMDITIEDILNEKPSEE